MLSPKTPLFSFMIAMLFHHGIVAVVMLRQALEQPGDVAPLARLDLAQAEADEPAARAQQPVVLAEAGGPDRVEGDVDALAVGDPHHLVLEVVVAVVDRVVDALGADRVVLGGRGRAEDLGAVAPGDLGRGDADAAGRRLDQQPVALAQAAHHDEPRVGGAVVDRDRGALLEGERVGQRQHVGRRSR